MITSNKKTRVVIVGGGAAALEAKYAIRDFGGDRAAVDVFALDAVISVDREHHRILMQDRTELDYDFLVAAIPPRTERRIVGLPFDGGTRPGRTRHGRRTEGLHARCAEVLPPGHRPGRFHHPGLPQGEPGQDLAGL